MSHIKSALKKAILERLNLVPVYPYFRKHLKDGDFIVIWKDENENFFVARSNTLLCPSYEELSKIPLSDRMVFNSFDRSMAVDHFIKELEQLDV